MKLKIRFKDIVIILIGIGVFRCAADMNTMSTSQPNVPVAPSEQVLAKKDPLFVASESARWAGVTIAGKKLKKAARDPSSIEFIDAYANDTGTLVCITYRGKNGLGGMGIEQTAIFMEHVVSWNKFCKQKNLYNMKFAVKSLN